MTAFSVSSSDLPTAELPTDLDRDRLPRHVAAIMDGNGRWARQRGLPRIVGHQKGVDSLRELVRACSDWGVAALTVYAFSTENWKRPLEEVDFLLGLIARSLRAELPEMTRKGVRVRVMGDIAALPPALRREIAHVSEATQANQKVNFTLATNYGGRQEIVQVCRDIAEQVKRGELEPGAIDEQLFAQHLATCDLGDPDLVIRTSGELRLSNFLLWQLAYAELYVTDTLWPDFDRSAFHAALLAYQKRDRRFGKVSS